MNIIVVGCGKIGKVLVHSLVKENHNVTAIDNDEAVVNEIRDGYDVMTICGNGTSYGVLKKANVESCDLFIAATSLDELNMLSCFEAKKMGAKYTIARIRNPENNNDSLDFMKKQLELSLVINPEQLAAQAIHNLLKLPAAAKLETFGSNQIEMLEFILKPNSPLDGMTLKDIKKKYKGKYLICTAMRGEKVFIPKGASALKSGDRIGLIVAEEDMSAVLEMLEVSYKRIRRVMIIGGGIVSRYLANLLLRHRIGVKIIDADAKVCEKACEELSSKVTVLHGNAMNQDLLMEEGLRSTDALIALTGKDEENILISYYAMSQSVSKAIAKVNQDELFTIAEKLGLDSPVSTRRVTADAVVKYARALENTLDNQIEALYSIMGGMAEALEFKVLSDSKLTHVPLKEMKLKKGVLIAGIVRAKEVIIPGGDDVILPEDKVIVIVEGIQISALSEIIQ